MASHLTFVSSRLVNSLKVMKIPAVTLVYGIEQTTAPASKFKVDLNLHTTYEDSLHTINVRAAVVDTITGDLPERVLPGIKQRPFLKGLQLADLDFDKPGRIDLLLGMNVLNKVLLDGRSTSNDGELCAYRTIYGWVVLGNCDVSGRSARVHVCLKTTAVDIQTHELMSAFWKVEDVSFDADLYSVEEQQALDHFQSTVSRETSGRYVV